MSKIYVIKRDGKVVDFDLSKISAAMEKAFNATDSLCVDDLLQLLSMRVVSTLSPLVKDDKIHVEDIQDCVEKVLCEAGFITVARAYIRYRHQHENIRNATGTLLDYKSVVDDYLKVLDWRVKENSTVTYSLGGLILSNSGAITANYWLSEIYDKEIADAHRNAEIHIHDLSMLSGYCAGWSLRQLIQEGLGGIVGKITSAPAKHLSTLCNQMVNFLGIMQNEWAGAQAFSSFDTYLAPFVKADNLSYKEVKQAIQCFIYGVNTPSRWGTQAPFSNVTLDWVCPPDMKDMPAIVGGKEMDFTYGDCKKEMDMVNKAFIEIMIEGDANGRGFQYPIPTYSITKDFDWSDTENNRLLFEMTAKYGTPYFSNYINSDMEPSDVRSMCPLTGDTKVIAYTMDDHTCTKTIEELYKNYLDGKKCDVWTPNGWAHAIPTKQDLTKVYEITMNNGAVVKMGENHLQPTKDNGILHAKDLKVGMEVPFTKASRITLIADGTDLRYATITEIKEIPYDGDLYCFEVDSDDHIFMLANGMYTHNCRLRLDLRELRKKSGGYFGSGESTGSVGVVTINLPRIAYQAYNEQDFYDRLDKLMDISARSLKIKREVITKFLDAGLYPYTKRYLGTFANHFSTIGLVGMNEAGLNAKWLHKDLTHKETQQFAKDVLNHMRERLSDYQEQYGDLYNLEATPAESTSYRFAKHDKQDFPDIITANEHGTPYYTNSSHLPVGYTKDIFSALDVQDELQTLYTSGTVFHAFLGEKLPSWEAAAKLVRKIAENYKLPYYTMSPTYSVCPDCGYITGEQYTCPKCGKKTEVYSRITGYYRPVQNWNDGKTQEFKDRQTYDIGSSVLTHQGPIQDTGFDEAVERAEETLKHDEPACLLFTTSTCPKCPIAKRLLDDAKVPYTLVVADKEPEKAKAYGIHQAPTLVCNTKDGEKITVSGLSEIKEFIQNLSKLAG